MSQIVQNSRILIKRSTTAGEVPTIPATLDHTNGTWLATDIYSGELFLNIADGRMWMGLTNSIKEIIFNGTNSTFLSLTDVPLTYSGQSLKGLRVNVSETALEFYDNGDYMVALDTSPTASYYLSATYSEVSGNTLIPIQRINNGATGSNDLWSGSFIYSTMSTIVSNLIGVAGITGSIQLNAGDGTFTSPTSGDYDSTVDSWDFSYRGGAYGQNTFTRGNKTFAGHYGNIVQSTDGTGTYLIVDGDETTNYSVGDSILIVIGGVTASEERVIATCSYDGGLTETTIYPTVAFTDGAVELLINLTTTSQPNSTAEGNFTIAIGENSHTEGYQSISEGVDSHSEGSGTLASGIGAHSEGINTVASGDYAHAEGSGTDAKGEASHAEGLYSQAVGLYAHAEGNSTQADGDYSHTEGYGTLASGDYSHAQGRNTVASADYSNASGYKSAAQGLYSNAYGIESSAVNVAEVSLSSGKVDSKFSQKSNVVLGCITTGTSSTVAKIDYSDTAVNYILRVDSSYLFSVGGVCRASGGSSSVVLPQIIGGVKNIGGTNSFCFGPTTINLSGDITASIEGQINANEFEVICNGPTYETHWTLTLEVLEINY